MSAIDDLIAQITDEKLRALLQREADKLKKGKKFGLVFEPHLPERTLLHGAPVRVGSKVTPLADRERAAAIDTIYTVTRVDGQKAWCAPEQAAEGEEGARCFFLDDIVPVAEFGEPIYPWLQRVDAICNAPESTLWHTLIEAENYHALQTLAWLYAGQVDCIYIDPPYNTGAKDWKYNNDYVDSSDAWRHSKWLAMMERRLKIAKKLLNPRDSVLIVTIDEKEYLHLGCLLEEMFPEARMQMVSSVINVKGTARNNEFARVNEYIYIIQLGANSVVSLSLDNEWLGNVKSSGKDKVRLAGLMRSGTGSGRSDSPGCFYPIIVSTEGAFIRVGESVPVDFDRSDYKVEYGEVAVWPIHRDGSEGRWMYRPDGLRKLVEKGYVYFGKLSNGKMGITYTPRGGVQKKIESGELKISGYDERGAAIIDDSEYNANYIPGNQWAISSHNATEYGTKLLINIVGGGNIFISKIPLRRPRCAALLRSQQTQRPHS
ncbi:MAG: site-specific DNA-methyltransferase [Ottowia sp.]|nr:site-specific DNA-methyltransferase [Ottowia sp.]